MNLFIRMKSLYSANQTAAMDAIAMVAFNNERVLMKCVISPNRLPDTYTNTAPLNPKKKNRNPIRSYWLIIMCYTPFTKTHEKNILSFSMKSFLRYFT